MPKRATPEYFLCPITQELINDPVVTADGQLYERSAIERWLYDNITSPLTNQTLPNRICIAIPFVKQQIELFFEKEKICTQKEFLEAIKSGKLEEVEKLNYLESHLNSKDTQNGGTPLHWAASQGYVAIVKFLLTNKVKVDAKDNKGRTPLLAALVDPYNLTQEQIEIVELLIDSHASVKEVGNNQQTIWHYLAYKNISYWETPTLNFVDNMLWRSDLIDLVRAKDNNNNTPLHYAVIFFKRKLLARRLLQKDESLLNSQNNNGETPLHISAHTSEWEMLQELLENWKPNLGIKDNYGRIPLHYAYDGPHGTMQGMLEQAYPEGLQVADNAGITPQHLKTKKCQLINRKLATFDHYYSDQGSRGEDYRIKEVPKAKIKNAPPKVIDKRTRKEKRAELAEKIKTSEKELLLYRNLLREDSAKTIQSIFRGSIQRKKEPLSRLTEGRRQEIKDKITQYVREERHDEVIQLTNLVKSQHWHTAMQLIRKIPEKNYCLKIGFETSNIRENDDNVSRVKLVKY